MSKPTVEQMRAALIDIECRAANALNTQPEGEEDNHLHLNKALALIELAAHCARRAQSGAEAAKQDGESPARGVESQVPRNGEAEGVRTPVGRESVAQGGTRSNT